MIGLGNDYLVNYEFAWTKTLSKNHLGYFSRSSAPAARPTKEIKACTHLPSQKKMKPHRPSRRSMRSKERGCMGLMFFDESLPKPIISYGHFFC